MIKSSQHTTKFNNIGKQAMLNEFLNEYHRVVWELAGYFWNNKVYWTKNKFFDIKNNHLDVPNMISTTSLPIKTELSARALKIASGEALGIIRSQTEKRRKQLYILAKLMREGDSQQYKKLQSKIDRNPLIKPSKSKNKIAPLNSTCCQFIPNRTTEFDGFLKISSIGKAFGHIYMPIKLTKHVQKLMDKGYEQMTTWRISADVVYSTWQMEPTKSTGTKVVGADQGLTTCLSLSDKQVTGTCNHGHDLKSIIDKLSRKQKGSKGFKKAQAHRTNYINWSINQLNLSDINEIRLERLYQMRSGQNVGNKLSHWTYTEINTKVHSRCEELGVLVTEQSAMYRSQRCSDCGWTQKSIRKGKEFICKSCGVMHDADINGALNHEADIYRLPFGFWQLHHNRKGFYWTSDGVYDVAGQALTVPDV